MNIKQQYSTRSLGTPTVFSGQNIFQIQPAASTLPNKYDIFLNGTRIATDVDKTLINTDPKLIPMESNNEQQLKDVFRKNLNLINGRLNAVHKELTYWDLYKISASVNSAEEFYSVFASLSIGQSMVINSNTFSINGVDYHRGDVIVKISEDNEIKIDSIATGIYFPQELSHTEGTDTYEINYHYTSAVPSAGGKEVKNNKVSTDGAPNINLKFNVESSNPENNSIYGIYSEGVLLNNDYIVEFPAVEVDNNIVRPVVKIFTEDNEEIFEDFTTSIDTTQSPVKIITISNWKKGLAHHVQVK